MTPTALLIITLFTSQTDAGLPIIAYQDAKVESSYEVCLTDAAIFNKAQYPFEINDLVAICIPTIIDDNGKLLE